MTAAAPEKKSPVATIKFVFYGSLVMAVGYMGLATLNGDSVGEILAGGLISGLVSFLLIYLGYAVILAARGSLRFGVRSAVALSRTAGIGALRDRAAQLAAEHGLAPRYTLRFARGNWRRTQFHVAVRPIIIMTWLVCWPIAFFAGIGFLGAIIKGNSLEVASVEIGPFFGISLFLLWSLDRVIKWLGDSPHLGKIVIAGLRAMLDGAPVDARAEAPSGEIDFGNGAPVLFEVDDDFYATVTPKIPIWPVPLQLTRVTRKNIKEEDGDVDLGDGFFDRFSIMRIDDATQTVCEAWLTRDVRALLMVLLADGADVKDGQLVLTVSLTTGLDRLLEALPRLATLAALVRDLRDLSETARTFQALEASTEPERTHILKAVGELADAETRNAIRRAWAINGTGATRITAACALMPADAVHCLGAIAEDRDATAALRGHAYAHLLCISDAGHAKTAAFVAACVAADDLDHIDVLLALGPQLALQVTLRGEAPPPPFDDNLALTGVTGAALAFVLACLYGHDPQVPAARIQRATLALADTLPADGPQCLPAWQAYGRVLTALAKVAGTSEIPGLIVVPSADGIHVAGLAVKRVLEELAARTEGGLSVASPGDSGLLTLIDGGADDAE